MTVKAVDAVATTVEAAPPLTEIVFALIVMAPFDGVTKQLAFVPVSAYEIAIPAPTVAPETVKVRLVAVVNDNEDGEKVNPDPLGVMITLAIGTADIVIVRLAVAVATTVAG